jgi:hypothetical protein
MLVGSRCLVLSEDAKIGLLRPMHSHILPSDAHTTGRLADGAGISQQASVSPWWSAILHQVDSC